MGLFHSPANTHVHVNDHAAKPGDLFVQVNAYCCFLLPVLSPTFLILRCWRVFFFFFPLSSRLFSNIGAANEAVETVGPALGC